MAFKTGNEDKELVIDTKEDAGPRSQSLCRMDPDPSGAFLHLPTFKKQKHLMYVWPCGGAGDRVSFLKLPV